jgi:heme-degrading monooxygenase HmoA
VLDTDRQDGSGEPDLTLGHLRNGFLANTTRVSAVVVQKTRVADEVEVTGNVFPTNNSAATLLTRRELESFGNVLPELAHLCVGYRQKDSSRQAGSQSILVPTCSESVMIMRMWKARAMARRAEDYVQHATKVVFPKVSAIEEHRGAYLLRRQAEDDVELMVLTFWDSMEAIPRFAGPEPSKAVVEPEARAVLSSFDEYVTHFEVVDRLHSKD